VSNVFRSLRMAPVLAVVLGLLALGASLAGVPPAIALHQTGPGGPVAYTLLTLAVAVPGTAVGVVLAARRPRNAIGWLLLALLLLTADPASAYAILDYRLHHGTLPLGWVAVVLLGTFPAVPVLLAILLWVFPDGRLPPGRWLYSGATVLICGCATARTSTPCRATWSARSTRHSSPLISRCGPAPRTSAEPGGRISPGRRCPNPNR